MTADFDWKFQKSIRLYRYCSEISD